MRSHSKCLCLGLLGTGRNQERSGMVQHCVGRRKAWIRNERQMRRRISRHRCAIGMEGQIRKANCSLANESQA